MSDKLTPRINYVIGAGDTTKTKFDFKFPIQDKNDLKAITSDGVALKNYTVEIYKDKAGGCINLANPLALGTKITLYREMPYTRQTLFRENEDFRASVINSEFDRMIMLLQQAGLQSKDSIRNPLSDNQMDMVLPTADTRKDSILGFDDKGKTKVYKNMSSSYKEVEKLSKSAKDSADNAKRDRLLVDKTKTSFENDYLKKTDFKTKYDEVVEKLKLPTKIFTQTSGKFFVRNADGSLPSGIDSTKVWSLADQKTANGGTMPSGKIHIELPLIINGSIASGGGAGGLRRSNGGNGGDTTMLGITAKGGLGGKGFYAGVNGDGKEYVADVLVNNSTISSSSINNRGGIAGAKGNIAYMDWHGSDGQAGSVVSFSAKLTAGQVIDFTIGAGASRVTSEGRNSSGGENGYIEVEYM